MDRELVPFWTKNLKTRTRYIWDEELFPFWTKNLQTRTMSIVHQVHGTSWTAWVLGALHQVSPADPGGGSNPLVDRLYSSSSSLSSCSSRFDVQERGATFWSPAPLPLAPPAAAAGHLHKISMFLSAPPDTHTHTLSPSL